MRMNLNLKSYRTIGIVMLITLMLTAAFGMRSVWAESASSEGVVSDTGTIGNSTEEMPLEEDMTEVPELDEAFITHSEKARVLSVVERTPDPEEQITLEQTVQLEILTGKFKGQITETINVLSGNSIYELPVSEGDKVMVHIEEYPESGDYVVYVSDYVRDTYIYWLAGFFLLCVLAIGRMQGLKTIVTLVITMTLVYKVLLPALLAGYSPILITVGIAVVINIVTYLVISGFQRKSYAAIIGASLGVIIAGVLAYTVGSMVRLTGLSGEEAGMLLYIPQGTVFNFKELMFSGILLGALGAVMDVAMSISSAIDEVHRANPLLKSKALFAAGMSVGKDIMGTMSNTLILAYTGSSIPLLLIFMAYDTPLARIINLDLIATEIVRSLAGTIGLVLTIPITAVIAVGMKGK